MYSSLNYSILYLFGEKPRLVLVSKIACLRMNLLRNALSCLESAHSAS